MGRNKRAIQDDRQNAMVSIDVDTVRGSSEHGVNPAEDDGDDRDSTHVVDVVGREEEEDFGGLVPVATLVVEEEADSEFVEGGAYDSDNVDVEEGGSSSATSTATTVATTVVVLEAKPLTFSHSVEDVLRHRRGKACIAMFVLCVFAVLGGIAFFATHDYNNKQHHNNSNNNAGQQEQVPALAEGTTIVDPQQDSTTSRTEPPASQADSSPSSSEQQQEEQPLLSPAPTTTPTTLAPTAAPTSPIQGYITSLIPLASTQDALRDETSPQSKAYQWLVKDLSSSSSLYITTTTTKETFRTFHNKSSSYSNSTTSSSADSTLPLPYSEDRLVQRFALATLYYATRGVGWRFQQFWLSSTHECDWYTSHETRGSNSPPVCDEEGNYIRLVLVDNILRGTLPPQLGLLTHLERLQLQGDNFFGDQDQFLAGSLPSELGLLGSSLELLDLSKNGLTGSLPSQLGQLTQLRTLRMLENQLTGTIPVELLGWQPPQPQNLTSSCNTTTPTTANASSTTTSCDGVSTPPTTPMALEEIRMYDNLLSGPLPTTAWAGMAPSLKIMDWANNRFSGTLPSELSLLTNLNNLDVQGNQLTGTIPSELGLFPSLEFLKLNENQLTGTIPVELSHLGPSLSWLLFKNNHLTGTMPRELGQLIGVTWLLFEGNHLTGTIPTEFGLLNRVRFLRMHENNLEVNTTVPDEVCELQRQNWWFYMIEVDCIISCGDCRLCLCN